MSTPVIRDKLGRRISERHIISRRRNMLISRFAAASGLLQVLARELQAEYQLQPFHGENKAIWLPTHMQNLQDQIALLRQDCDEFFFHAYGIKTPVPPPEPRESDDPK